MIRKFRTFKSRRIVDDLCEKYGIENYTINEDMSVSVVGFYVHMNIKIPKNFNFINYKLV